MPLHSIFLSHEAKTIAERKTAISSVSSEVLQRQHMIYSFHFTEETKV